MDDNIGFSRSSYILGSVLIFELSLITVVVEMYGHCCFAVVIPTGIQDWYTS